MAGFSANKGRSFDLTPTGKVEVTGKDRDYHTIENAPGSNVKASGGDFIIDGGDGYIYHVFTSDGTFTANQPSTEIKSIDFMLVGGGGGGSGGDPNSAYGGSGGGGGIVRGSSSVTPGTGYPISIGGGGGQTNIGPYSTGQPGSNGSPTTAFGRVAIGGAGGDAWYGATNSQNPLRQEGGSGGGAAAPSPSPTTPQPTQNADFDNPASPEKFWQGHDGAAAVYTSPPTANRFSGGGGGAGGSAVYPGAPVGTSVKWDGGDGNAPARFPLAILAPVIYASSPTVITMITDRNGWGYGGDSSPAPAAGTVQGYANTGGGSQGNTGTIPTATANYDGGSGIVIVRYIKSRPASSRMTVTGTVSTEPETNVDHVGLVRHIFTGPGTFTVTDPTLASVRYLVVGGGGGGGGGSAGGPAQDGGGAGGGGAFVTSEFGSQRTPSDSKQTFGPLAPGRIGSEFEVSVGAGPQPVNVGGGGAGSGSSPTPGTDGGDSWIGSGPSRVLAPGGGGGAGSDSTGAGWANGNAGGSSGGAAADPNYGTSAVGTGDDPDNAAFGSRGFGAVPRPASYASGGGGGGAGGYGDGTEVLTTVRTIHGQHGMWSPLSPPNYGTPGLESGKRYFAGGGGAGAYVTRGTLGWGGPPTYNSQPNPTVYRYGQGGYGGGGTGGNAAYSDTSTAGTTNTGGGGGGSIGNTGSAGGSGIVIIEYPA